jgi:hypothetical protein
MFGHPAHLLIWHAATVRFSVCALHLGKQGGYFAAIEHDRRAVRPFCAIDFLKSSRFAGEHLIVGIPVQILRLPTEMRFRLERQKSVWPGVRQ